MNNFAHRGHFDVWVIDERTLSMYLLLEGNGIRVTLTPFDFEWVRWRVPECERSQVWTWKPLSQSYKIGSKPQALSSVLAVFRATSPERKARRFDRRWPGWTSPSASHSSPWFMDCQHFFKATETEYLFINQDQDWERPGFRKEHILRTINTHLSWCIFTRPLSWGMKLIYPVWSTPTFRTLTASSASLPKVSLYFVNSCSSIYIYTLLTNPFGSVIWLLICSICSILLSICQMNIMVIQVSTRMLICWRVLCTKDWEHFQEIWFQVAFTQLVYS